MRQLRSAGVQRHRASMSISARPPMRHPTAAFAEALQRAGGSVGAARLPAARHRRLRPSHQPPAAAIPRSFLAGAGQCRGRARRPGPPLSVRREARRRVPAFDGRRARRAISTRSAAVPDRFQHPQRVGSESVLYRRPARRSGDAQKLQGQEGHRRRHGARTRRPLQRSERRHRLRTGAAGAGRGIDPAEPRAALDLATPSRWPGSLCSRWS